MADVDGDSVSGDPPELQSAEPLHVSTVIVRDGSYIVDSSGTSPSARPLHVQSGGPRKRQSGLGYRNPAFRSSVSDLESADIKTAVFHHQQPSHVRHRHVELSSESVSRSGPEEKQGDSFRNARRSQLDGKEPSVDVDDIEMVISS